MIESWKHIARLEKDGDSLYMSSKGRCLVACEKPSELDGGPEDYILDLSAIAKGEVSLSNDGHYGGELRFQFPRECGYPITENKEAAKRLHKALYQLGLAPVTLEWKVVFDAAE